MGWGTHEKKLPNLAYVPKTGPKNQIMLAQMGMNTWVRSWVPDHEIVGMVIRHGEAFGISDKWTVWKDGKAIYRPTVHYAYMPCDATIVSLHELGARNYEMQSRLRIMDDKEITSGADILGALLMGHAVQIMVVRKHPLDRRSQEARPRTERDHHTGGTRRGTAVMWMIENPKKGSACPTTCPTTTS